MRPIYLDYNATTPHAPEVVAAMRPFLEEHFGNPSSAHRYGAITRDAVAQARSQVAGLLNSKPDEIVFTSGGTESNNYAIRGTALARVERRRHIITSRIEHPAVTEVCRRLEHAEVAPIDPAMQPLFRDVTDHVLRLREGIDGLREVLAFAFEARLMTGQAEQTEITRRLAAGAAILAVPTAIAGIYGMNFEHMPELKWQYGYPLILGVIIAICGWLYWRFRKNGWI